MLTVLDFIRLELTLTCLHSSEEEVNAAAMVITRAVRRYSGERSRRKLEESKVKTLREGISVAWQAVKVCLLWALRADQHQCHSFFFVECHNIILSLFSF